MVAVASPAIQIIPSVLNGSRNRLIQAITSPHLVGQYARPARVLDQFGTTYRYQDRSDFVGVVAINKDNVVDFLRQRGAASTDEIRIRFALTQAQVNQLVDGLEDMGHIKRAWVIGPLWDD